LRLAPGTLALLDGDPGVGKSLLTVDLAARLTTGRPLPDGSAARPPCAVVMLNDEDPMENTLVPRLQAAGANIDLLCDFSARTADGLERPPLFPDDCQLLAETIQESGAPLAVIDPLSAYVAVGLGSPSIGRVLDGLAQVARETGAVILLLRHLVKWGRGLRALFRGFGGVVIPGRARTVLLAGRDPDDEELCLLAASKSNLGPLAATLAYRIAGGPTGQPVVDWAGPVAETANDVVIASRPAEPPGEALADAMALLQDLLGHGPATYETVLRLAHASGIAEKTLRRAKAELKVRSVLKHEDDGSHWHWSLPEDRDSGRILEELFGPGFKPKSVHEAD
jgi:hypothetical protein